MTALMAHMIPYYPDKKTSLEVARGIIRGGAQYLEIQFPFSDPTADGPVIEAACTRALKQGFTVDQGFAFVRQAVEMADRLKTGTTEPAVAIMTYASLVHRRGVDRFCAEASQAGAMGLIVPDLPVDSDEGLAEAAINHGLKLIPVVVPTTTDARLDLITQGQPEYIYCALRTGITGSRTEIGPENHRFLQRVAQRTGDYGGKILGGFGIQEPGQVKALEPYVYGVVVGSALVRIIQQYMANPPAEQNLPGKDNGESLEQRISAFVQKLLLS